MNAVCLLLCVVLAREAAGHIFRRQHYPQMDSLIVQPLEYINQAEALYPQERLQQYQQEERSQYPQQYSQQKDQQSQQKQQYPQQKQKYSQEKQQYSEEKQQYPQKYSQQKKQQYLQKDNQQVQNQYEYQEQVTPQQFVQKKQVQRSHDSTSVESNSQEIERISEYAMPMFADVETLNSRLYRTQNGQAEMKPVYGDAITWRGVQIAATPAVETEDIQKIYGDAFSTMQTVSSENQQIFHQAVEQAVKSPKPESHLNTTELLFKNQYPVETHTIKTDDGYYLTLFRIPSKDQTLMQKPVVFLMHGLLGSSDDWLLMGPGKSLAYLLADAGYDVWLGNARGNRYSRHHVSKHYAQADFWQFSTDEIALHDLPAMIDYALKTSNQQKLYYVGHSQGTTAFFALAATRPEYNDKIIMMYALSPMVYMSGVRSPLLRMIAPTSPLYENLHQQLGHGEFKPSKELVFTVGGRMCETKIGCKNVCSNVNFAMSGVNVNNLEVDLIPVIMGHLPAGGSTRQMKQYAQGVASREFTKYDFGAEINEKVYGSRQPPKYEMSKVKTPVALFYSEEDWLAHPQDVQRLEQELPIVKESYKVPDQHFTHMDFQFSKNAPEVVYSRLIESIQKQSNKQDYFTRLS